MALRVGFVIVLLVAFPLTATADTGEDSYTPGGVVALHSWLGGQCSFVPDLNVGECCLIHDLAYQQGGTEADRRRADVEFRRCVRMKNGPLVAWIYYSGVRLFGWLFFNYS